MLGSVVQFAVEAPEVLHPVLGLPDGVLTLALLHVALVDDAVGLAQGVLGEQYHGGDPALFVWKIEFIVSNNQQIRCTLYLNSMLTSS